MRFSHRLLLNVSAIAMMTLAGPWLSLGLGQEAGSGGQTAPNGALPETRAPAAVVLPQSNAGLTPGSVPRLLQFSGVLRAPAQTPDSSIPKATPNNGAVLTFSLYEFQEGGAPLWSETQTIQTDGQGRYTVLLGATQPNGLPLDLFMSDQALWLSVQPETMVGEPARVLLVAVPYALKAADADTLGGLPASAFLLAGAATAAGARAMESNPKADSAAASQPAVGGTGTQDYIPIWTDSAGDLGNSVLYQSGTGSTAKVGINITTPATTLDVKGAATIRGALTLPAMGTATATTGYKSQPLDLAASVFNSSTSTAVKQTFQWQAEPVGNDTSTASGSLNLLYASGTATPAETGLSVQSNGVFTFASGQTFPGAGTITGVSAGTGLSGGGTSGAVTLSNTGLLGVVAGTGISSSGGQTPTIGINASVVPQLAAANIFTGNQTVNGNLSATQWVSGAGFEIGSNPFGYGNYANANAFLGFAGNSTMTGNYNTAIGLAALSSNAGGSQNTASGPGALYFNTTGTSNTASGLNALYANTTGNLNTATGYQALQANIAGYENMASGFNALGSNTTGSLNTATGSYSLNYNTTGSSNTALGYGAGPDASTPSLTNSTAIGANADVTQSNSLVLGSINGVNGATANTNVGIGTTAPAHTLDVHGTGNFTGLVNFASGQTFPGAGTITGVTAGTALTGGGTSGNVNLNVDTTKVVTGVVAGTDLTGGGTGGNVTLNVDTTKVPQLAAANTFTGAQTINNNVTIKATGATLTASGGTTGVSGSGSAYGMYGSGSGSTSDGVYGQGNYGVYGYGSSIGLYAYSTNSGSYGVYSQGVTVGVFGYGTNQVGVYGVGEGQSNTGHAYSYAGVWGDTASTSLDNPAILGTADTAPAGIFVNNSTTYDTLDAIALNSSSYPFSAFNDATGKGCIVDNLGDIDCSGNKNAVVPIDGGQHQVALSAIESPENWFEDFGSGKLSNGSAVVRLEPVFAQTVNTELEYHVFLTPNGDCKGLYISQKSPTSFEVRELGGGTSNVRFDYRIVALRKDFESIRLADHTHDFDSVKEMAKRHAGPQHNQGMPPALTPPPAPPKTPGTDVRFAPNGHE